MKHIGIAGLGKMGSAMARNLLDRGYSVSVWNRSRGPVDELVAAGAIACDTPAALTADVDAVIVMLWGDEVAREVSLGQILPAAPKGRLVIECSTLSPSMYDTLAAAAKIRGIDFLACPVIGSTDRARSGSLSLLPGGAPGVFERAHELLSAIGSSITFTGSPEASAYLKLSANSVLGVVADTAGELLRVLNRAGVDRTLAIDIVMSAFERASASKRQQLLDRDVQPRFSAGALLKDLQLAKSAREKARVRTPVLDSVLTEFESITRNGLADEDYIAVTLAAAE